VRILLIHSFYNAALPSGENEVVRDEARLLTSCGHEVLLWGPQTPPRMSAKDRAMLGLNVMTGRGRSPAEAISSFAPDLIHVHNLFPNISTDWLGHASVPIISTLHNYRAICANGVLIRQGTSCTKCISGSAANAVWHSCYRNSAVATAPVLAFQRRFRRAAQQQVAAVIFTSELSKRILEPVVHPQRSILLHNYVPALEVGTEQEKDARRGFLTVGRLSPEKGLDKLIEAWPSPYKLTFLGDGPERARLEALALGKNIEFRGFVADFERDQAMRSVQALILPSITMEADPVVVAQALSCGTPCIAKAGTATAQLAETSTAVLTYQDSDSLKAALEDVDSADRSEPARRLYGNTWSDAVWMHGFYSQIVEPLGIFGYP